MAKKEKKITAISADNLNRTSAGRALPRFRINWNLVDESGNFDHWRYRVTYEEYLSNLPWVRNTADAVVEVIAPQPKTPLDRKHGHQMDSSSGTYIIRSTHNTCFYGELFCGK